MKSLIKAALLIAVIAAPVASFAQSNRPISRAQVNADLVQIESAGYNPRDWIHYPENIQAAEARIAAQNDIVQASPTGYGAGIVGSSQAGGRADKNESADSSPVHILR
ncbi:DUF4148 domain-containing protein [Paraburkholderia sp. D1E]|uniref:DUF4148 domain-containing protein n=1 Tax=Paraburkholderia sp. D1E TaxID=3461398 RepID=UPI004045E00C